MSKTAQRRGTATSAFKHKLPVQPAQPRLPFWSRFRRLSCSNKHDLRALLVLNLVNLSVPAPATRLEKIRAIASGAALPLPIEYLDPILGTEPSIRGAVFLSDLGRILNDIAINYQDMVWWLSDEGLVMKILEPPPVTAGLAAFDRIAGARMPLKSSGLRLSNAEFSTIVAELDGAGEKLKGNLQPAQWAKVAAYNQKHSRASIQSFSDAVKVPLFSTFVRRRLYVAREAYAVALSLPRKHLEKYDAHLVQDRSYIF